MSVKLIDNTAFYGFRVRRTVDGKLYQEYYSLIHKGVRAKAARVKAVKVEATKRDDELKIQQDVIRAKRITTNCFREDGSVRGISLIYKKEKSGTITPIFQVGIMSEELGNIICTSFSINAHGVKGAWKKAVECYAHHKQMNTRSRVFQKIKAAMPEVVLTEENTPKISGRKGFVGRKVA